MSVTKKTSLAFFVFFHIFLTFNKLKPSAMKTKGHER